MEEWQKNPRVQLAAKERPKEAAATKALWLKRLWNYVSSATTAYVTLKRAFKGLSTAVGFLIAHLNVPVLLGPTAKAAYMVGVVLGTMGVLKIHDHVENPNNAPLKEGAIRIAAGGGLFALPGIYSAMQGDIGDDHKLER